MYFPKLALTLCLTLLPVASNHRSASQEPAHGGREEAAFEAASIKPRAKDSTSPSGVEIYRSGRIVLRGFNIKGLVAAAFNLPLWQIEFPEHMDETLYDVEARAPELPQGQEYDTRHGFWTVDDPHLKSMLISLLSDRFHMAYGWRDERGTVYILERSTKPLLLKPTTHPLSQSGGGEVSVSAGIGWSLFNASMQDLADHLSRYTLRRPVVDKTGLEGGFYFQSRNVVTEEDYKSGVETVEGMLPEAVNEMGLKLTKTTGDVKRLTVTHIEVPSEN